MIKAFHIQPFPGFVVAEGAAETPAVSAFGINVHGGRNLVLLQRLVETDAVFGGHGSVAGGRIKLSDPGNPRTLARLERRLQKGILQALGVSVLPASSLA